MKNEIVGSFNTSLLDSKINLFRPRIYDIIINTPETAILLFKASPGFGKKEAIKDYLNRNPSNIFWIQFIPSDNLLHNLWEHCVYLFSFSNLEVAEKLSQLGFPDSQTKFQRFIEIIKGIQYEKTICSFILEDFHLISNPKAKIFFERLINRNLKNTKIFILVPENISIHFDTPEKVTHLNENLLRFSFLEMKDFFAQKNLLFSTNELNSLYAYTSGWPLACNLLALRFQNREHLNSLCLFEINLDIFDLIEDEIFSILSKADQKFLVMLTFVENMHVDLLLALNFKEINILKEINNLNVFIHFNKFHNTINFHPIFNEFLQTKLSLLSETEIYQINYQAATWYSSKKFYMDAIHQFLKIKAYDEIIEILLSYDYDFKEEYTGFFIGVLENLPAEFLDKCHMAKILHIKFLLNHSKIEQAALETIEMQEYLENKLASLSGLTKEEIIYYQSLLGEVYIFLAFINYATTFSNQNYLFPDYIKKAHFLLPGKSKTFNSHFLLHTGIYNCTTSNSSPGSLKKLSSAFSDTMPYMTQVLHGFKSGLDHLICAELNYFQRNLRAAEKSAYQAIYRAREYNQFDIEGKAWHFLLRIHLNNGDFSKIKYALDQQKILAHESHHIVAHQIFEQTEGWFFSQIKNTDKIAGWIKNQHNETKILYPFSFSLEHLIRQKINLAEENYFDLLAALKSDSNKYYWKNSLSITLEFKIIKAIALYRIKEHKEAIQKLNEAYLLAADNFLHMPFIEQGSYARTLLQSARDDKDSIIPVGWIDNIVTKSSTYAKKLSYISNQFFYEKDSSTKGTFDLSKRELDILNDLCHGLTRKEIADHYEVSVNTIKCMIINIYAKLGAINSLDAVRIATIRKLVK